MWGGEQVNVCVCLQQIFYNRQALSATSKSSLKKKPHFDKSKNNPKPESPKSLNSARRGSSELWLLLPAQGQWGSGQKFGGWTRGLSGGKS